MSSLARALVLAIALVGGVTACSPENAQTQFERGMKYDKGQGVPKDITQAVTWYRKAAEQGLAEAQFALGGDLRQRPRGATGLQAGVCVVFGRCCKWIWC